MNQKLSIEDWKNNQDLQGELLTLLNQPVMVKAIDTLIYSGMSKSMSANVEENALRRAWAVGYMAAFRALDALTQNGSRPAEEWEAQSELE